MVTGSAAEGATSTRVWSFGLSDGGLLGHGNGDARTYEYVPRPIVALDRVVVVEVAAGVAHSIALTATGTVFSWGSGEHGRLGHGTSDDESTPTHLICLRGVLSIAAGGHHSMASAGLEGQCYTWGSNEFGQLGLGIAGRAGSAFATPMQAKRRPASWLLAHDAVPNVAVRGTTNVAAGMVRWHCTTLRAFLKSSHARGTPPRALSQCVGTHTKHVRSLTSPSALSLVPPPTCAPRPIVPTTHTHTHTHTTVQRHSLVLDSDGTVLAAGSDHAELGATRPTDRSTFAQTAYLSSVVAVDAGLTHSMALTLDGDVFSWGTGLATGVVRNHITYRQQLGPTKVDLNVFGSEEIGTVVAIAAGRVHSMALTATGIVLTWGCSEHGQLGHQCRPWEKLPWPKVVRGLKSVTRVSAGANHSLVTTSDGRVLGFGANGEYVDNDPDGVEETRFRVTGKLGLGATTVTARTPTVIPGLVGGIEGDVRRTESTESKEDTMRREDTPIDERLTRQSRMRELELTAAAAAAAADAASHDATDEVAASTDATASAE